MVKIRLRSFGIRAVFAAENGIPEHFFKVVRHLPSLASNHGQQKLAVALKLVIRLLAFRTVMVSDLVAG